MWANFDASCLKQGKKTFNYKTIVNLFIVYLFKLTINADRDKYSYYGYNMRFDTHGTFSLSDGSGFGKNIIIFEVNNSSSVHAYQGKKDNLNHGKDSTDGSDDTTLTAEVGYSINFSKQQPIYYNANMRILLMK